MYNEELKKKQKNLTEIENRLRKKWDLSPKSPLGAKHPEGTQLSQPESLAGGTHPPVYEAC